MKLTKRKIANIIAKWKTGQYTKTLLSKKYGVSEGRVRAILKGIPKENENLVKIGVALEASKKYEKSTIEAQEIDKAIKAQIETIESDNKLISNNRKLLLESQKILSESFINKEINSSNIKNVTGAIKDIEAVANPQAKTQVNVQNNTAINIPTLSEIYGIGK